MKRFTLTRAWSLSLSLALTLFVTPAQAWFFPEHAEITRVALSRKAPPRVLDAIEKTVIAAKQCITDDDKTGCLPFTDLPLCDDLGVPFHAVETRDYIIDDDDFSAASVKRWLTTPYAPCIPYSALPALAGDHAVDVEGLDRLMRVTVDRAMYPDLDVAGMVVGVSVDAWKDFRDSAPKAFTSIWEAFPAGVFERDSEEGFLNRRKILRDLDARLLMVDHDYATRAGETKSHFQDGVTPMHELINQLVNKGNTDNALNQMLARHLRSLVLASAGRQSEGRRQQLYYTQALLEHAFAVHFMQDAFSAGHVATEPGENIANERLKRHDHLNRRGLAVRRALAQRPCASSTQHPNGSKAACWVAFGDGFIDHVNLDYVAEATAVLQLQFAIAVEGSKAWMDDLVGKPSVVIPDAREAHEQFMAGVRKRKHVGVRGRETSCWNPAAHDPNLCALNQSRAAQLLNKRPHWIDTNPPDGKQIVIDYLKAMEAFDAEVRDNVDLRRGGLRCDGAAGGNAAAATLARRLLGGRDADMLVNACTVDAWPNEDAACHRPSYRLWQPVLVVWPAAQADVQTLEGKDSFGDGLAFQVVFGANASLAFSEERIYGVFGPGVAAGLAYRLDSVLPGRDNRGIVELNVGLGPVGLVGLDIEKDDFIYATVSFVELRVPVVPILLASYGYLTRSSNVITPISAPFGVGLYGLRLYTFIPSVNGELDLLGWDAEIAFVSLGRESPARTETRGLAMDPELRLRLGQSFARRSLRRSDDDDSPDVMVGLEIAGGFSWFL